MVYWREHDQPPGKWPQKNVFRLLPLVIVLGHVACKEGPTKLGLTPATVIFMIYKKSPSKSLLQPKCLSVHIYIYTYSANILTVLSTAFGSVTFLTLLWLWLLQPKAALDLKLYSSMSLTVIGTAVGCDNHCQITVGNVTQPMTVNWL